MDLIVAKCCGEVPIVELCGDGSAYIYCSNCKRKSKYFSVHHFRGDAYEVVRRKDVESAVNDWNKSTSKEK